MLYKTHERNQNLLFLVNSCKLRKHKYFKNSIIYIYININFLNVIVNSKESLELKIYMRGEFGMREWMKFQVSRNIQNNI